MGWQKIEEISVDINEDVEHEYVFSSSVVW
jgi:hypothetical protein